MPPRTRKRQARISYVEEPNLPEDEFEQVFNILPPSGHTNSDEESDYHNGRKPKRRRKAKGKRSISQKNVATIPLAPDISDQESESDDNLEDLFSVSEDEMIQPQPTPATITLHLPVHLQNTNITLNLNEILDMNLGVRPHVRLNSDGSLTVAKKKTIHWSPINLLPTEIRVRILRFLLVSKDPIEFTKRQNLNRSAQVLQISRAFHDDGTRILYGENCFHFERAAVQRGKYWESQWKEVGFKDVRRFLRDIGENKKKLRYVSFRCVDATPTDTIFHLPSQRRFVNDAVLLECFAMIADSTILEKFAIGIHGRAMVLETDCAFLRSLTRIKCYDLTFTKWFYDRKIGDDLMDKIRALMEIQDKDPARKRRTTVKMLFEYGRKTPLAVDW